MRDRVQVDPAFVLRLHDGPRGQRTSAAALIGKTWAFRFRNMFSALLNRQITMGLSLTSRADARW